MGFDADRFREGRKPVGPETDGPADPPPLSLGRFRDRAGWSGISRTNAAASQGGSGIWVKLGQPRHA